MTSRIFLTESKLALYPLPLKKIGAINIEFKNGKIEIQSAGGTHPIKCQNLVPHF